MSFVVVGGVSVVVVVVPSGSEFLEIYYRFVPVVLICREIQAFNWDRL